MTMARVEVITSVQRRRRWSMKDKQRIVAAALEPGAVASEIARRAGIHTSQLFRWRRQLCGPSQPTPAFAAVALMPEPVTPPASLPTSPAGVIDIELAAAARVRISGAVDPATVSAVIGALAALRR
jgi:transposase